MSKTNKHKVFFDDGFEVSEQLPREFNVSFIEVGTIKQPKVQVKLNGSQLGDIITDNAYENDFYRYHDIFHYTFASMLGWSPCSRAMMKRKRKSSPTVDEIEDGARATITEEAISLIIFNEARRKAYFENRKVSRITLRIIREMTDCFEVKKRTEKDWEHAILKSYELFRLLIQNKGGTIHFDMSNKLAEYSKL